MNSKNIILGLGILLLGVYGNSQAKISIFTTGDTFIAASVETAPQLKVKLSEDASTILPTILWPFLFLYGSYHCIKGIKNSFFASEGSTQRVLTEYSKKELAEMTEKKLERLIALEDYEQLNRLTSLKQYLKGSAYVAAAGLLYVYSQKNVRFVADQLPTPVSTPAVKP